MDWQVGFHPAFLGEHAGLDEEVQDELAAMIELLKAARRRHAEWLQSCEHEGAKVQGC